ncbi:succinate dehydrogenase cytochrome b558 subunit [Gorillibacterium timonense]|uniref:succinate dehydrogenase cytochrome b558 subunit n=1 Tax=Gorillibacterium timonense TaxID=1689269 RepID=UPI00071D3E12|nr:succinate dehydrogenase cytochrome b558 subunit [Gorillibacterium timonense]
MKGNSYYYRKIHSLLGVFPVGFFLLEHLITNYSAYNEGHEGFIQKIEWINKLPLLLGMEILFIWLPILYHGIYGMYVAFTAKNNVKSYGYYRNILFMLQRVTGVITLIFIGWHVYETRIQLALGNVTHDQLGVQMHEIVTQPVSYALYIIGTLAASFHFTNGMWSFLVSWGITVGPRAQKVSGYIWFGLFIVMAVMFVLTLNAFTGSDFEQAAAVALKG